MLFPILSPFWDWRKWIICLEEIWDSQILVGTHPESCVVLVVPHNWADCDVESQVGCEIVHGYCETKHTTSSVLRSRPSPLSGDLPLWEPDNRSGSQSNCSWRCPMFVFEIVELFVWTCTSNNCESGLTELGTKSKTSNLNCDIEEFAKHAYWWN